MEGSLGSGQRGCREEVRASWVRARPSEARAHGRSVTPRSVPDPRFRLRTLPPPRAQCQPVIRSHITKETHGGQVSRPRSHLLGQEKPGRPCFLPAPSPHRPSQVFRVGPVPGLWGELGRRPLLPKGSRHRPSPQTKAPPGNLGSLCAGPRRSSPQVAPFPDMSLAGAGGKGEGQRGRTAQPGGHVLLLGGKGTPRSQLWWPRGASPLQVLGGLHLCSQVPCCS